MVGIRLKSDPKFSGDKNKQLSEDIGYETEDGKESKKYEGHIKSKGQYFTKAEFQKSKAKQDEMWKNLWASSAETKEHTEQGEEWNTGLPADLGAGFHGISRKTALAQSSQPEPSRDAQYASKVKMPLQL